jgi:hypothetical protein
MNTFTPIPAIVAVKIKQFIRRFEELGATSPGRAVNYQDIDIPRRLIFYRLVHAGVIVETEPNKYYLDRDNLSRFNRRRRMKAAILIILVVILAIVLVILDLKFFK